MPYINILNILCVNYVTASVAVLQSLLGKKLSVDYMIKS